MDAVYAGQPSQSPTATVVRKSRRDMAMEHTRRVERNLAKAGRSRGQTDTSHPIRVFNILIGASLQERAFRAEPVPGRVTTPYSMQTGRLLDVPKSQVIVNVCEAGAIFSLIHLCSTNRSCIGPGRNHANPVQTRCACPQQQEKCSGGAVAAQPVIPRFLPLSACRTAHCLCLYYYELLLTHCFFLFIDW